MFQETHLSMRAVRLYRQIYSKRKTLLLNQVRNLSFLSPKLKLIHYKINLKKETPSSTRPKILSFRGESTKSMTKSLEKRAIETQTDWSWIQDQQFIQKIKKGSRY